MLSSTDHQRIMKAQQAQTKLKQARQMKRSKRRKKDDDHAYDKEKY
jgi:hypothetical protein